MSGETIGPRLSIKAALVILALLLTVVFALGYLTYLSGYVNKTPIAIMLVMIFVLSVLSVLSDIA